MDARSQTTILVAIGANLPSPAGEPRATVRAAMDAARLALGSPGGTTLASTIFATPCFPAGAGPDYVNAALAVESELDPETALVRLHEIEARFGRTRHGRWTGRSLDLDLIAAGDAVRPGPRGAREWIELAPERQRTVAPERLILPHPRLQDRAFVLVPLAEVAPEWRHPLLDLTVAQMLRALPDEALAGIRRIEQSG